MLAHANGRHRRDQQPLDFHVMSAFAANAETLIRNLGSAQHLDRERSRLKLRASLRDTGVA